MDKEVYIFDLDGTLSESRSPADSEMTELLSSLLATNRICILSGASFTQIQKQLLDLLPEGTNLANLVVAPMSGAAMYIFGGAEPQKVYDQAFSEEELQQISISIAQVLQEVGFDLSAPSHGERLISHDSQVSFALLGEDAPNEEKEKADPDSTIRKEIIERLSPLLPMCSLRVAGGHTIDINKKGVDKAYAIDQLPDLLNIPLENMIFVGDELFPGGNDEVVKETNIDTHQVTGPEDTKEYIRQQL